MKHSQPMSASHPVSGSASGGSSAVPAPAPPTGGRAIRGRVAPAVEEEEGDEARAVPAEQGGPVAAEAEPVRQGGDDAVAEAPAPVAVTDEILVVAAHRDAPDSTDAQAWIAQAPVGGGMPAEAMAAPREAAPAASGWGDWAIFGGTVGAGAAIHAAQERAGRPEPTPTVEREDVAPEAMTPAHAAALSALEVTLLAESGQLNALSASATAALVPTQMTLITANGIQQISPTFIAALAPATIVSLNAAQMAALGPQQLGALTQPQIHAIVAAGLAEAIGMGSGPGGAPALQSVGVAGETDVDVRTHIVLTFDAGVAQGGSDRFIRIVDNGAVGGGFHGESTTNNQTIAANHTAITVVGNKVVIDLPHDLDFASSYHIEFDAGAFVSAVGGVEAAALAGPTQAFSTVKPSDAQSSSGQASVIDDGTGLVVASAFWWDMEGRGTSVASQGVVLDAQSGANVYVIPDHHVGAADPEQNVDGVGVNDFYVELLNFGAEDLVYVDNLGRNDTFNHAPSLAIVDYGTAPTRLIFDGWDTGTDRTLGGQIDIHLEGSDASFSSLEEWQSALGLQTSPYITM